MTYRAPISDILLALNHGAGLQAAVKAGHYGDFDGDITAAVLEEAGKFAADVLAPLNTVGRRARHQARRRQGDDRARLARRLSALDRGGMERGVGAGSALAARACRWRSTPPAPRSGAHRMSPSASARCSTLSAIEALDAHGNDELKKIYLEKLVTGEWTGTMQLTEPQAGSDVGALRTRAEQRG